MSGLTTHVRLCGVKLCPALKWEEEEEDEVVDFPYDLSSDNLVCTAHALLEFAYRVQKLTRQERAIGFY